MIDNIKEENRRLLNKGYLLSYVLIAIIALFMLIIYYLKTGQLDIGLQGLTICLLGIPHAVRGVVYNKKVYLITGFGFVTTGMYFIFRYAQLLFL